MKTRIKVALRKCHSNSENKLKLSIKNLLIDPSNYRISINNRTVNFTKNEIEILFLLSANPGKFFSRNEILNLIWKEVVVTDRTVDTHIAGIRNKLQEYSKLLETKVGVGYSFNPGLIDDKE